MPGGDAGGDEQPGQPLGRGLGSALAQRVEEGADDRDPFAPVVGEQPERAADVQHDDEGKPEGLRFGLRLDQRVPAEQAREEDRVPEARDREELGDSLEHAEDDRLEVGDRFQSRISLPVPRRCRRGSFVVFIKGR